MALTFCPDPPNLCDTGPGTAAEQSARPRMYADYVNGGWTSGEQPPARPMTPLTAVGYSSEFTLDLGWLLYASEPMNWVSGALTADNEDNTQFNFEAFGPYTVTATAVDDAAVTTIGVLVRDQANAPRLTSLTPATYDTDATTPVEILLTGSGFTADARPRVVLGGRPYEPSFELISATQMRIWIDPSVAAGGSGPVFVWKPDGSTTYGRDLMSA